MKNKENIEYQFTKIPTKLMYVMDINCRSMLYTLCQVASVHADEHGIFFRSNEDLALQSKLSQKLVIATVDTLYSNNLIQVFCEGKGKGKGQRINRYRINYLEFAKYDKYTFDELKNPDMQISTVDYRAKGYSPSYLSSNKVITEDSQISNNIDNINNIDKINNKEDNILIDNILRNKNDIEIVEKEEYESMVSRLFEEGNSISEILRKLANVNCEYYFKFKSFLREHDELQNEYIKNRELIEQLNSNCKKIA